MHALTFMLLVASLGAVGCAKTQGEYEEENGGFAPPPAQTPGSTIPAYASAKFEVEGYPTMGGAFLLNVGPAGRQVLRMSALALDDDGRPGTNISGTFELPAGSHYKSAVAPSDWSWTTAALDTNWLSSAGSFSVNRGATSNLHLIKSATITVDSTGTVTAALVLVPMTRIDRTTRSVIPGSDVAVKISGRLTGSCSVYKDPTNTSSPVISDPTLSSPDCQILSGL